MTTLHRRHVLQELLTLNEVKSQQELVDALAERGLDVTQTTISRDLSAIGAVKSKRGYALGSAADSDMAGGDSSEADVLRAHVLAVVLADAIVVVKTKAGHSAIVADAIDASRVAGVAGTIAGENTIFVATQSKSAAKSLAKRWNALIAGEEAA